MVLWSDQVTPHLPWPATPGPLLAPVLRRFSLFFVLEPLNASPLDGVVRAMHSLHYLYCQCPGNADQLGYV